MKLKITTINVMFFFLEIAAVSIGGLDPNLIVLVKFPEDSKYIPYSVTHVPTGMSIKSLPKRLDCIRFAQAFWNMLNGNERLYFKRLKAPARKIDPSQLRKEVIDFVVNYGR